MRYFGRISDPKDLTTKEFVEAHHDDSKQDELTAGENITIVKDSEGKSIINALGGDLGFDVIEYAQEGSSVIINDVPYNKNGREVTIL